MRRAVIVALCVTALAGCKRKHARGTSVLWEGSPTSLTCSEDHHPGQVDVFTCVGNGRVYTCIQSWRPDALIYSCGQVSSPMLAESPVNSAGR